MINIFLGVHCAVFQIVLRHLLNPPESLLFQWIPGDCFLNSVIRFEVSLEQIPTSVCKNVGNWPRGPQENFRATSYLSLHSPLSKIEGNRVSSTIVLNAYHEKIVDIEAINQHPRY